MTDCFSSLQLWTKATVSKPACQSGPILLANSVPSATQLLGTAANVQVNHKSWVSDPLEQLDAEAVDKEVQASYKVLYKMNKVTK